MIITCIVIAVLLIVGLTAYLTIKSDNAAVDARLKTPEWQAHIAEYNKRYGIKPKQ
jgi:hypothetical protein